MITCLSLYEKGSENDLYCPNTFHFNFKVLIYRSQFVFCVIMCMCVISEVFKVSFIACV